MKNPLLSTPTAPGAPNSLVGDPASMMPPPLSAIITPRVSEHEGNRRTAAPRYFSGLPSGGGFALPSKAEEMPAAKEDKSKFSKPFTSGVPVSLQNGPCLSEESDSDAAESKPPAVSMPSPAKQQQPSPAVAVQQPPPPTNGHISKAGRSSSESSSESSSSDDEDSNKSSSDAEHKSKEDEDKEFSLTNLLGKVKSTHSPGPNMHPSPKLQQVRTERGVA